jgi:hypothetical protein
VNELEQLAKIIVGLGEKAGEALAPEVVIPLELGLRALFSAIVASPIKDKPWTLAYKIANVANVVIGNHDVGNGNGPPK